MRSETLEIKRNDAVKAHQQADKTGKKLLENLLGKQNLYDNIRDRIDDFDDILELNGITQEQHEAKIKGLESDEVAYIRYKLIVKAYNEGRKPNYCDGTAKYEARVQLGSSSGPVFGLIVCDLWSSFSFCGARLSFLDSDNLRDAFKKFGPILQEFYQNQ